MTQAGMWRFTQLVVLECTDPLHSLLLFAQLGLLFLGRRLFFDGVLRGHFQFFLLGTSHSAFVGF
jgi:hypothetical protein